MPILVKYTCRGVSTRASQETVEDEICAHLQGLCEMMKMGRRLIDYELLHGKMIIYTSTITTTKTFQTHSPNTLLAEIVP